MSLCSRLPGVVLLQVLFLCAGMNLAYGAMELPSRLKEIPIFAGSKTVQVMDAENNSMALFTVKADRDALLDHYKQAMKGKGWKVVFQAEQEEDAVVHFQKEKDIIQLSVQKDEGEGMLQYQLVSFSQ